MPDFGKTGIGTGTGTTAQSQPLSRTLTETFLQFFYLSQVLVV
jgi:hypothetical protein